MSRVIEIFGVPLEGIMLANGRFALATHESEARTYQRAVIDVADAGDNILIAGEAGFRTYILSLHLIAADAVTLTLFGGNDIINGPLVMGVAGNGLVLPEAPRAGWFTLNDGDDLFLSLSAGVQVSGSLTYWREAV